MTTYEKCYSQIERRVLVVCLNVSINNVSETILDIITVTKTFVTVTL